MMKQPTGKQHGTDVLKQLQLFSSVMPRKCTGCKVSAVLHAWNFGSQHYMGSILGALLNTDEHLRKVLKSFEVCWCDGVDLPTKATTVLDKVGRAIKCNSACAGVHHDLQIPVRRKNTKTAEYIAAQCCYGNVKGARPIAQDTPSQGQESTGGQNRSGHTQRAAPNVQQGQSGLSDFKADLGKLVRTSTDTASCTAARSLHSWSVFTLCAEKGPSARADSLLVRRHGAER